MHRPSTTARTWSGIAVAAFVIASLLPLRAGAMGVLVPTDRRVQPLAIRYHRVNVELTNGTAVTKIEQVFHNHTRRDLEATFYFPMPEHAAIIEFSMWMNGKKVTGKVLGRRDARQIYEAIVRRMRDPGLIEWAGHSLFKARIYPVPARGDQKIEISYTQVLPYEDGVYRYLYPLQTTQSAARTLEDFTIQATLQSKTPIRNVYSPTHKVYVHRKDEHHATIGFEKEGALLQKDFELLYTVSKKDIGLNLLTYRPAGEPGYFLLMAAPKATWAEKEIIGKSIVFVIDTSGSMAEQDKMEKAQAALRYCVEHLNAKDRFDIVRFSSDVEAFRSRLVSAGEEREAALTFIDQLEPAGGTAIHDALQQTLKTAEPGTIVVFITDGRPTVGETETKRILADVNAANDGRARLFTFGVGSTVNTKLLDSLAADHGGVATYVAPDADMEKKITAFYNKMSYPVLSELDVTFRGVKPFAMQPRAPRDLFRGDQLLLIGRYRGDGDTLVRLSGKVGDDARTYDFEGRFPEKTDENAFIAQIWAHRQVGYLLEQVSLHGETPELVKEVTQLATRFGIVTPYTSYLVTEPKKGVATPGPFRPIRRTVRARPRGGMGGAAEAPAAAPFYGRPLDDEMEDSSTVTGGGRAGGRAFRATRRDKRRRGLKKSEMLRQDTGRVAVETSKAIREMKEEEHAAQEGGELRYVHGKVFRWQDGWVDTAYRSSLKTIKMKYLSDAYMKLLEINPSIKRWLSLGSRVTVVVNGVALIISEDGRDEMSAKELESLKK